MAKQKIPTEDTAQGVGAKTFQEPTQEFEVSNSTTDGDNRDGAPEPNTSTEAPEPKQEKVATPEKEAQKQVENEADSFTLGILKTFPNYKTLYVDRHGGVFTPDTPKSIRGSATLYKNPHYKG